MGILTFAIPRRMQPAIQIGFRVDPHFGVSRFGRHLARLEHNLFQSSCTKQYTSKATREKGDDILEHSKNRLEKDPWPP